MISWWYQPARIEQHTWIVNLCRSWGGIFTTEPLKDGGDIIRKWGSYADAQAEADRLNERPRS